MDGPFHDTDMMMIRGELAKTSFEDLQKMKKTLGSKVYNQTLSGKKVLSPAFTRANKNRPREESSKIKTPVLREVVKVKRKYVRDPRFDATCGEFKEKVFHNTYSFLKDIKRKEKEQLYLELKKNKNINKKEEIKYLIQRMENQDRAETNKKKNIDKLNQERRGQVENLLQGKEPTFIKKSERKVMSLVDRYEELKKKGKLKKHIEKINKKKLKKSYF